MTGYHMALVAGVVFFMLSAGLRWFRTSRLRRPIKKWANVLSGAEVASLSMVGVPQHIAELVIGHALPGIVGVYDGQRCRPGRETEF